MSCHAGVIASINESRLKSHADKITFAVSWPPPDQLFLAKQIAFRVLTVITRPCVFPDVRVYVHVCTLVYGVLLSAVRKFDI